MNEIQAINALNVHFIFYLEKGSSPNYSYQVRFCASSHQHSLYFRNTPSKSKLPVPATVYFMKISNSNYGIVVAGHGSRDIAGVQEFEAAISLLKKTQLQQVITHGFLEFAKPTIDTAIRQNIQRGSTRIVMIPAILFAASHGKNDMPIELLAMKQEFPQIEFQYGGAMELHPLLLKLFQERIVQAEAKSSQLIKRSETLLVVVGRGTTDPDINSNVNKLARMMEEGMGFAGSYVCYSGTATPLVAEGIEFAVGMGFKRLIVIPYFLFTGILVKRIYQATDAVSDRHPEVEILKAQYLGVHQHVTDVWMEKAQEGIEGRAVMNCSLCKYRVQIVGFEDEVGTEQRAHHLHVRGMHKPHHHPHPHAATDSPLHCHERKERKKPELYHPHPLEVESFKIIERGLDWSKFPHWHHPILQRLVYTSGDFSIVDDVNISVNAIDVGVQALISGSIVITDVSMVQSGLKRNLLSQLAIEVFCGVHEEETRLLSEAKGITRSAAGIRRAAEKWGDNVIVAIGDAPTAVMEAVRLVKEQHWRPLLIIGLPVGFIGTRECKAELIQCQLVPHISNTSNRGGSPWAATVMNALLIQAVNRLALA